MTPDESGNYRRKPDEGDGIRSMPTTLTEQRRQTVAVRWSSNSFLRNDGGDQVRGCHIECGTVNLDTLGRGSFSKTFRDLFGSALLNGDLVPRVQ